MAETPKTLVEAVRVARDRDAHAGFDALESAGEPSVVASLYSQSVFHLYGERDLPLMIQFGQAGIRYCLNHAVDPAAKTAEAMALRGVAKTIAYNLGSNCWPGWRDEGIEPNATDMAIGLDAARLNLRLAGELGRPIDKRAAAHWLLGAQLLANEKPVEASRAFVQASEEYDEAELPTEHGMCLGYAALADMTVAAKRKAAVGMFETAVESLRREGSDDAKFFAFQLETARAVFAGK